MESGFISLLFYYYDIGNTGRFHIDITANILLHNIIILTSSLLAVTFVVCS